MVHIPPSKRNGSPISGGASGQEKSQSELLEPKQGNPGQERGQEKGDQPSFVLTPIPRPLIMDPESGTGFKLLSGSKLLSFALTNKIFSRSTKHFSPFQRLYLHSCPASMPFGFCILHDNQSLFTKALIDSGDDQDLTCTSMLAKLKLPKFIKGYSTLAAPLTALTSTKVPFQWNALAAKAFSNLKQRFSSAPILTIPDPSLQFVVEADASGRGLRAMLSQEVEGEECLDIKRTVLIIQYYLLEQAFTLCLEHAPLELLHCMKDAKVWNTHCERRERQDCLKEHFHACL
ncbi:hypothetical protein QTP70_007117 [Hemibagrus guttatus]|uniref:Reverse transcriptase/retrotransposon-derived protein RNase H-like domain-containing protein n=1 Tax=Hemibagrus guttatus TaxID=175788 RepID=A0AAE0RHT5_9TELE|nr:hypothetical protein QTP70_007117 [Hemibagrus guttatus]